METLHISLDTNLKYYVHQKEPKAAFESHDKLITKGFNDIQKEVCIHSFESYLDYYNFLRIDNSEELIWEYAIVRFLK